MRRSLRTTIAVACLIAACGGETEPNPANEDRLDGAPGDPAVAAIEREPYEPRADDLSLGHPDLPSMLMSHRVAITAIGSYATVGEVNDLLEELDAEIAGGIPGVASLAGGLLALRLPLTSHAAMEAALASIRARPFVESAVQDMELGTTDVTDRNAGTPAAWVWDSTGIQDTWGLVAIRAPQLWNFNASIRTPAQPPVLTGVLDVGFAEGHEDLPIFQYLGIRTVDDHGTHVAGTIGASFNNKKGIDGVNPFSALVARVVFNSGPTMTYAAALWGLEDLIVGQPGLRVVNLSLGYNWYRPRGAAQVVIDVRSSAAAQNIAATNGAQVLTVLAALQAQGYRLPFIAAAAGNDSRVLPGVDARYGSPFANAALAQGAAPITVVEADSLVAGAAASYVRSDFSNSNGHLSAPGSQIWSSVPGGYGASSGTSMATPHVAGLVGYLYALAPALPAPTLTANPVRDLLIANLQPGLRNGRPQIDAFASALALDGLLGGDATLRRLVDIDDGTSDGNLRLNAADAVVVSEDLTADGGRIDMADFRRWRDWLLQVESAAGLALDGTPDHPKKDPNGDGAAGTAPQYEALYSRGDFNGDGKIDRTGTRPVAGRLGGQSLTDLQVMQQLFDDPDYTAADLPGLIASGDIHVNAEDCLSVDGAATAWTTIALAPDGAAVGEPRSHIDGAFTEVLTVPAPGTYSIRLEVLDGGGSIVGGAHVESPLALGEDVHLRPVCDQEPDAVITLGWGGEPMGGEIRLYAADVSTGGERCNVLYQPIPVPPVSSAPACQLAGATANGSWTAQLSAPPEGPVTITVSGIINMSQGASAGGGGWESFASSALSAYLTVSGGTARYELNGSVQVSGYQGTDWNLDAWITFNSSQGPITTAFAGGCHRAEGCAPASVPLSATGELAPGLYSIGGLLRAGTGHVTSEPRSGTAQYTYQLIVRP